jgi:hypothetical protein
MLFLSHVDNKLLSATEEVKILFCEPKNSDQGCIAAPHSRTELAAKENLKI